MEPFAINKEPTLQIAQALFPGVIASVLSHNHHYLLASFYAVCSIMPFTEAHHNKPLTYLFSIIIASESLVVYALIGHWMWLFVFLAMHTAWFSVYETQQKSLKTMTSWWLIGVVYAGFHLHQARLLAAHDFLVIIGLAFAGLYLALYKQSSHPWSLPIFSIEMKRIRYYLKYPLALGITIAILAWSHVLEGQWLIWSCFSVLSLDFIKAKSKYQQRLIGVAFGVSLGLLIIKITPYSALLEYVYLVCILLSLRLFQSYLYSFATRCLFVVLYAGSHYHAIGYARLTDIALGGATGLVLSYALRNRTMEIN